MAKVYISSTKLDLAAEREAVTDWLVAAHHQPVHSYQPDSETVRDSVFADVDACDLYVLILAHRYGFQPEENNPENLSITHLEFRRAVETTKPVIALLRRSIPDISLSDLSNPARLSLVQSFETEVRRAVRPAEFTDGKSLIEGLSTGIIRELDKLKGKPEPARQVVAPDDPRAFQIIATLTEELARQNRLIDQQASRITDLETALLRSAVARTLTAATQPDSGESERTAVEALRAGNTAPAEAILNQQERQEAAQIGVPGADETSRIEAAALAREQGALAMNHNVIAALEAFQRAAEYEPNDTWTHLFIGDLHLLLGSLGAAMDSFNRAVVTIEARLQANADDLNAKRDLSVSNEKIGGVLVAQGDGPGALNAYRKSLEIAKALAARDPTNTEWQRDLSVSNEKIGNVLVTQGDGAGALDAYRTGLGIREALAARDPTNTEWLRDLSVSHEKIGDVLIAQGDGPGALNAYRKGLEFFEALAARDRSNTQWQRDLSVSYDKIGNVLVDQGDGPGALNAYRKSLEIGEALTASDPANTQWQRDLSVSHNKIGNVLLAQGDTPGALNAYRKGLEIREALAARDPANTQWRRDLFVSHNRIADVLVDQGDGPGALNAYRKAHEIVEVLAARDPANKLWLRDLSVSHDKIGNVLAKSDGPGALTAYRKSLEIAEALALRDPANTQWQRDLSVSHNKIGDVLVAQSDGPGALNVYRKGLQIAEALAARDPASALWQTDLAVSFAKLGTLAHLPLSARRDYLQRGREVLLKLKQHGRLLPSQDSIAWFDEELGRLTSGGEDNPAN